MGVRPTTKVRMRWPGWLTHVISDAHDVGGADVVAIHVLLSCVVEVYLQRRKRKVVPVPRLGQPRATPRHQKRRERREHLAHLRRKEQRNERRNERTVRNDDVRLM